MYNVIIIYTILNRFIKIIYYLKFITVINLFIIIIVRFCYLRSKKNLSILQFWKYYLIDLNNDHHTISLIEQTVGNKSICSNNLSNKKAPMDF